MDMQTHLNFDHIPELETEMTDYHLNGYFRFPGININNEIIKFEFSCNNDLIKEYFYSLPTEKASPVKFFLKGFSFLQNSCHAAFENQVILIFSRSGLPKTITAERMPRMTPILPNTFGMVTFSVSLYDHENDQKYRFN